MEKKLTRRQVAAQETRKKILGSARKLIAQKGFEMVSVDEIMEDAGLGKGTFYTYFRRKEDVLQELNQTDFFRLAETVNAMAEQDIVARLEHYCREFMKCIERGGIPLCRQWIRNNLSDIAMTGIADADGSPISKYRYDCQALHAVLAEGVRSGLLIPATPVEDLSLLINAELYGLMIAWCMSDGRVVGSLETGRFADLVLRRILEPYFPG